MRTAPSNLLVAIIIGMVIIVGGITFISEMNTLTNTTTNQTYVRSELLTNDDGSKSTFSLFNNTFNKVSNLSDTVNGTTTLAGKKATDNDDMKGTFWNFLDTVLNAVWSSISLIGTGFIFVYVMIGAGANLFGLPTWVGTLIVMFITIIVSFALLKVIFKVEI